MHLLGIYYTNIRMRRTVGFISRFLVLIRYHGKSVSKAEEKYTIFFLVSIL